MSAQVKTKVIFPVYTSASRTEFRLENKVYLNTFRLANLQTKPDVSDVAYVPLGGVTSAIQNIVLFSGNTPIDESRNSHEMLAFSELRNSNAVNLDIAHENTGTKWGFQVGPRNANDIPTIVFTDDSPSVKPDSSAVLSSAGTLNLQKVLPYLSADDIVPGSLIPNLRLVIEWRTNEPNNVFSGASGGVNYEVQEPQLFVDEVVDPSILSKVNSQSSISIPYFSWEQDRVRIPLAVINTIQSANLRINGFNNKSVRRMLMVNIPEDVGTSDAVLMKNDASVAMHEEVFNFRLNGRQMFALNGVNSENKKLDQVSYVFGSLNVPQGCQYDGLSAGDNFLSDDVKKLQGHLSYGGFWMGYRISDLELQYKRYGRGAGNQLKAFYMDIYGEVSKQLVVKGGQVTVAYA